MIQGILTFQFKINSKETGEIEPEFESIQLIMRDKNLDEDDFSALLGQNDIFAKLFYATINTKKS